MSKYVFNKMCQPWCSPDFLFYPCFPYCPPSSIKIENGVLYIVDLSIFTWFFKLTPSHLLLQLMTFSCIQNKSIRVATVVRILCLYSLTVVWTEGGEKGEPALKSTKSNKRKTIFLFIYMTVANFDWVYLWNHMSDSQMIICFEKRKASLTNDAKH